MDTNQVEHELAQVILDEVKAQRYTAREMQARSGIKARSWSNYFTSRKTPVPIAAVWSIGQVLGVSGAELMRRAEERAAEMSRPAATLEEHIERQLSPQARAEVRAAREALAEKASRAQPNG